MSRRLGRAAARLGLLLGGAAATLIVVPSLLLGGGDYHSYYIPSEAMEPTLEKNDRLLATESGAGTLRRGDILLFPVGDSTYIKRLAAFPGETVAMKNGILILNGRAVSQRLIRREEYAQGGERAVVSRLAERFPGEAREHQVFDLGPSAVDDMPARRVPPGCLFVLGDNRDRSTDSRVPRDEGGVAWLRIADVRGHAVMLTWPWRKAGRSLAS